MVLDINSKDYNNLRTDYSDPNIIGRVQGSEFLIDDASVVNFYFDGNPSITTKTITPIYTNQITRFGEARIFLLGFPYMFARSEVFFTSGYLSAEIDEVIYDKNSISIDYEIDYDTYKTSSRLIDGSNYNISVSAFSSLRNNNNLQNKDSGGNRTPQVLQNELYAHPKAVIDYAQFGFSTAKIDAYANFVLTQFNVENITVDNLTGKTTVLIKYALPIWYGWNDYREQLFANRLDNWLNVVRTFGIKIRANTINVVESAFDYGNLNEEPYALESNEFLQYTNGEPIEDRMSYETAQEIFEKTERNRMLVSFNLFRLDKLDWDGDGNLRYIRSRDRIKIKDELGNYLGAYYDDSGNEIIPEFEIIGANGKWDGKFYKEIIAKQVYIDS